jgi:ribose transport system ATP-binding protein
VDHSILVDLIMGRSVQALSAEHQNFDDVRPVLELEMVSGGPATDVSIGVRPGEIVGIAGLLGSGRSSILKMIFGLMPCASGTISLGGSHLESSSPRSAMNQGVAYVPEDRVSDSSFATLDVLENLGMASVNRYFRRGRLQHKAEASDGQTLINSFLIKTRGTAALMSSLSGGNQQKVVLARWLRRKPKVLLLDEPTQGVDVGARFEIWELVRRATAEGTAVLVVSSDYEELAGVCDRVLILRSGRIVSEVSGSDLTDKNLERLSMGSQ